MKKILGLAGGLLLLAGLLALFRLKQTTTEIPGAAVRFSPAHSLGWDPTRRLLTRTGDDPYGRIELPAACVPVQEVVIEFAGTPPRDDRSHFYVYQYPAYLEGVFYNDSYVVLGRPEPTPGGYRIRWQLANSKVVRLDLPDVSTASGLVTAQAVVIAAMANEQITPEEAASIASVLEAQRRAIETHDHERRIEALKEGTPPASHGVDGLP